MKILIVGKGKMGSLLKTAAEAAGYTVTGMADAFDLAAADNAEPADMVIDFSHRDNLGWVIEYVKKNNSALVYGTTGLSPEQKEQLSQLAKTNPVFFSANYSYGVAVLSALIKTAAPLLKDSFDIELTETHHNQKQDAPSGTAKALLELLDPDNEFKKVYGREGMTGARGKEIGVHALRGGTEAGTHSVYFFGENESITITHHADNRMIFVNGAIRAAAFLKGKEAGMFTMNDLLGGL